MSRLSDLHASFRRDLRAERRSENTLRVYSTSIGLFIAWLEAEGLADDLASLTRANIRHWLAGMDHASPGTVATRYRSLRRFCGWLVAEDELDKSPMAGMQQPREQIRPVPVLDDDHLAALLKLCAGKDHDHRRDEVMVRILLDCGVRVSELCGLTVAGVDLDQGSALVRGKGDKIRAIYFSPKTIRAIDRYLRIRAQHRNANEPWLLLTQRGGLSPESVRRRLRQLGAQIGVPDLHPHTFRHTFAADFLRAGGQERDLKRLAGWSSDAMLERYGSATADHRAREAVQRLRRGDRV